MTPTRQQYLVRQTLLGVAVNLALNAAIGWAAYRDMVRLPLSGSRSVTGDVIATGFLLPLLACLIVTPLVRAEVRSGKIVRAERSQSSFSRLLPRGLLVRGIVLGLLGAATLAPLTIWALHGFGIEEMSFRHFVGFKAAFGGLLAALITPSIVVRALMDPASRPGRSAPQAS